MTIRPGRGGRSSENTLLLGFGEVQPSLRDFEIFARIPGTGSAELMPRRPCRDAKRLSQNGGYSFCSTENSKEPPGPLSARQREPLMDESYLLSAQSLLPTPGRPAARSALENRRELNARWKSDLRTAGTDAKSPGHILASQET